MVWYHEHVVNPQNVSVSKKKPWHVPSDPKELLVTPVLQDPMANQELPENQAVLELLSRIMLEDVCNAQPDLQDHQDHWDLQEFKARMVNVDLQEAKEEKAHKALLENMESLENRVNQEDLESQDLPDKQES